MASTRKIAVGPIACGLGGLVLMEPAAHPDPQTAGYCPREWGPILDELRKRLKV